jgi:glycosyltransferase involved in cell wall biosynthesis
MIAAHMPRLTYITFGESLFSPLVQTQVIQLLTTIATHRSETIEWIALISPTDLLFQHEKVRQLRRQLAQSGVLCVPYPMPLLYNRFFLPRFWLLPLLLLPGIMALASHFQHQERAPAIIHTRSYVATLLAILTRRKAPGARILFDPRSSFPEEHVTARLWKASAIDFKMWKKLETYIVTHADALVSVSAAHEESYQDAMCNGKPVSAIIHNTVDVDTFVRIPAERERVRGELGIPTDSFVLVYCGSIGRWNSPEEIARYFACIWQAHARSRLLVITSGRTDHLKRALRRAHVAADICHFVRVPGEEVARYLKSGDAGLQVLLPAADSRTRIGVKFAEYMAAGLPVIVNSHAGASAYVQQYGVGFVVDQPEQEMQAVIAALLAQKDTLAEHCLTLARDLFDLTQASAQYSELYEYLR